MSLMEEAFRSNASSELTRFDWIALAGLALMIVGMAVRLWIQSGDDKE